MEGLECGSAKGFCLSARCRRYRDRALRVHAFGEALRRVRELTRSVLGGIPTRSVGTISVISSTPISALYPSLAATTDYCGRRHHVFDVALSRIKLVHRKVEGRGRGKGRSQHWCVSTRV
ncbi:hypothetical protein, partial [Pseudomonas viridiflava]|uniref:hypothetical protein n=1 Tax=Pseudomonas viridiflava TaxID=33069 RepID=UPI00197EDEA4